MANITKDILKDKWGEIQKIISTLPTYEELLEKYRILGANESLSDIQVPETALDTIIKYSPLIRNRLTLMRLKRLIK